MADFDFDPLLRDLARDAERRAHLADPAVVRHTGEVRRLTKGIGVVAGLILVTTGTFGLMTKGGGAGLIAASEAASGGTVAPTSQRSPQGSPSEATVPAVPTWVPTAPVTTIAPAPGPNAPAPAPQPAPEAPAPVPPLRSTSAPSAPPVATGSTNPAPAPTSASTPAKPGGSTSARPTPPTSVPTPAPAPPTSPAPTGSAKPTTGPAGPATPPQSSLASYQVTLYSAVPGGRIGERTGSPTGFGNPSGTLPYPHRIASAAAGSVAPPVTKPLTAAVGVAADGSSHITLFSDGTPVADHVVKTDWSDAQGLVAIADSVNRQLTVVAFHGSGTVTRVVIPDVSADAPPKVGASATVLSGLSPVTAATLARPSGGLSAYVVAGDRLLLVTVPSGGTASVATIVSQGMAGTTTLGRLTAGTSGAGGVVAWNAAGVGTVYAGPNAYGPLSPAGPAVALPR